MIFFKQYLITLKFIVILDWVMAEDVIQNPDTLEGKD